MLARSVPIILLCAMPQVADAKRQDEQLWLQANTNLPVAKDLRFTFEQIARFGNRSGGLYQTEIGGILGFKVARNVELGVGYRHVGFHSGNRARDEERLRQHVVATFGPIVTRLRVDERFHPGGGEIGFRIRPLIRYNHKLGDTGLAFFASHESFFLPNSTRWGQRSGYERMRNTVGVSLPVVSRLSADVGYLNQFRPRRTNARAEMDHAMSLQLTLDLKSQGGPRVDD